MMEREGMGGGGRSGNRAVLHQLRGPSGLHRRATDETDYDAKLPTHARACLANLTSEETSERTLEVRANVGSMVREICRVAPHS